MRHADDHFGMDCEWERMNSSKASPAHFTFPPILLPLFLRLLPWSGQSLLFAQKGSSSFRSWQAPLPCRRASKEAGTLSCAPAGEGMRESGLDRAKRESEKTGRVVESELSGIVASADHQAAFLWERQ